MAFVPVPKDLNRVKTKVMFNLTKRQLICFSVAAAVGGKTNELPLGQVEHDLRFDAVKILRDRNKCHCLFPPFQE